MKFLQIKNSVRGKLFKQQKINVGFFWVALGTIGRIWAKLGLVKGELGQNKGCE